jgi:molybdate transport system ATP-binding protein
MIDVAIKKTYGSFTLDACFESSDGVTALYGVSGAGKTSIVDSIAGLNRPDSGHIIVGGTAIYDSARAIFQPPERRGIGYVFQEDRLFPHLTVRRNLGYGSKRKGGHSEGPDFETVIDLLGIGHLLDRLPHRLSGGEKQRVAIGRAVLSRPRLLLMDEPLANLDSVRRDEILPFLEKMCRDLAVPIVYVSHAIDEITRLADTLVVLDRGKTLAVGPVSEITARLDLGPLVDRRDAGTVLDGKIAAHDPVYQLTTVSFQGGRLVIPAIDGAVGDHLRLRIQARDIAIATTPPNDISTLNCLGGTIAQVGAPRQAHQDIQIDVGVPILARVTRRSVIELGLEPGREITALIKSVAVERAAAS